MEGESYLVASDAETDADLNAGGVGLSAVIDTILGTGDGPIGMFFFDADRAPPPMEPNLSPAQAMQGTAELFIGHSTSPGAARVAADGANGVYAAAVARNMKIPGITLQDAAAKVRNEVAEATDSGQSPWYMLMLSRDIYFSPPYVRD